MRNVCARLLNGGAARFMFECILSWMPEVFGKINDATFACEGWTLIRRKWENAKKDMCTIENRNCLNYVDGDDEDAVKLRMGLWNQLFAVFL